MAESKQYHFDPLVRNPLITTILRGPYCYSYLKKLGVQLVHTRSVDHIIHSKVKQFTRDTVCEPYFDPCTPGCYDWDEEDVALWISCLGFSQYEECFLSNYITGRKLIWMDAARLCAIGIKDFRHIQCLTAAIRMLIMLDKEKFGRSIALPYEDPRVRFLYYKSKSGVQSNKKVFKCYLRERGYRAQMGCLIVDSLPKPRRCCIFAPHVTKKALNALSPPLCKRCQKAADLASQKP